MVAAFGAAGSVAAVAAMRAAGSVVADVMRVARALPAAAAMLVAGAGLPVATVAGAMSLVVTVAVITAAAGVATVRGGLQRRARRLEPQQRAQPTTTNPITTANSAATIPIRRATSLTKKDSPIKLTALSGSRLKPPASPGDLTFALGLKF